MSREPYSQQQVGQQIADARIEAGLTQADLAAAIGLDRTAVAKMESGVRKVAAVELARIATELDRPIDWFLSESPPTVVSRRTDVTTGHRPVQLDRAVDRIARDTEFLLEEGILSLAPTVVTPRPPRDADEARQMAEQVRNLLGSAGEPLIGIGEFVERLGLLCFSLPLGPTGGDGAYVSLGEVGVAVINGSASPGRRRFTAAHELGHHVFADDYATDLAMVDDGGEMERLINVFAANLLLPRTTVIQHWHAEEGTPRERAIRLGVAYRVSWSALCGRLRDLGLVSDQQRHELQGHAPTRADYLELGMAFVPELDPPSVPPRYAQSVLRAYRAGKLGTSRTIDLLWGTVTREELPELDTLPIEAFQREFDPLP